MKVSGFFYSSVRLKPVKGIDQLISAAEYCAASSRAHVVEFNQFSDRRAAVPESSLFMAFQHEMKGQSFAFHILVNIKEMVTVGDFHPLMP